MTYCFGSAPIERTGIMAKWVYSFGGGAAEGEAGMKNLLGGKGANLAEMSSLGLPVPPGLTITTEVCTYYYANGQTYPADLKPAVETALAAIGKAANGALGDAARPLLVSVRSGARVSMPGMMDTVLNLGLNAATTEGLAKLTNDPRFAYDSYRRFIQMYSDVVLGVEHALFEEILDSEKERKGVDLDTELDADDLKRIAGMFKDRVKKELGRPFPEDVGEQLWGAIGAVFGSWQSPRANTYRKLHNIPEDWGTAVTVQAMVFGNRGETSATGVAFTRDPSTGEKILYGEFLVNAQGEDVVAGIRTPQPITRLVRERQSGRKPSMEEAMPGPFGELKAIADKLEAHYRDMQDVEFTVQEGKLFMLQTRAGKRTAEAALKIAVDMEGEGLIDRKVAIGRVDPSALDQILHPTLDPDAPKEQIAGRLAWRRDGRSRLHRRRSGEALGRGPRRHPRARGDEPRRHPRHACGARNSHRARRHDQPRGGRRARYGTPLRLRRRHDQDRRRQGDDDRRPAHHRARRDHHHRRRQRPGVQGPRANAPARAHRRLLDSDAMGRRNPHIEGAHQRRHAGRRGDGAQVRRRRHRALPHRAHVLRRRPHRRGAPDDPRRRGSGPQSRAREIAADAALGLREDFQGDGRPSRHHPSA
jgi:hypothetical protein